MFGSGLERLLSTTRHNVRRGAQLVFAQCWRCEIFCLEMDGEVAAQPPGQGIMEEMLEGEDAVAAVRDAQEQGGDSDVTPPSGIPAPSLNHQTSSHSGLPLVMSDALQFRLRGSIHEIVKQKIKQQNHNRNATQLPGHFGKVPCSNFLCNCQGELQADTDLWLLFVFPQLDAGSLMRLLCTCKALGHRFVREVQESAARIFVVQTELPRQIEVLTACSEDLGAILDRENVAAWMRANELGLQWNEIGPKEPLTGTEIENEDLSLALQGKVEFTNEEFDEFQMFDLKEDSYVKVGDTYFKPAAKDPKRYFSVINHMARNCQLTANSRGDRNSFFQFFGKMCTDPAESLVWFTQYVEDVLECIRKATVFSEEEFDDQAEKIQYFYDAFHQKRYAGPVSTETGDVYSVFDQLEYEVGEKREAAQDLLDRLANFSDVLMFHSLVNKINEGEFETFNDLIKGRVVEVLCICLYVCMYVFIYIYIHMCVCVCVCMCMCMCMCTYISARYNLLRASPCVCDVCIYIYTYTHANACIYVQEPLTPNV